MSADTIEVIGNTSDIDTRRYSAEMYSGITLDPPEIDVDLARLDTLETPQIDLIKPDDSPSLGGIDTTRFDSSLYGGDSTDIRRSYISSHEGAKISAIRVVKTLGYVALPLLAIPATLLVATEVSSLTHGKTQKVAEAASAPTIPPQAIEVTTTQKPVETVPTTAKPVETTPTTAKPEFHPRPSNKPGVIGDPVGVFKFPDVMCHEEVLVIETSEQEDADGIVDTGSATMDTKIPDPTPNLGCDARTQRINEIQAETGQNYTGRVERVRDGSKAANYSASGVGPGNPSGKINFWQPVAIHTTSMENEDTYLSYLPCDTNDTIRMHSVEMGHGSMYNAAFGDTGLLKQGDKVEFDRADGTKCTYEVITSHTVENKDYVEKIINYSNPNYMSTMAIGYCSDASGKPGSGDDHRYMTYLGLVS